MPQRGAGPDQHAPGATDRGVAAQPLEGVAPGRRDRQALFAPHALSPSPSLGNPGPSGAPRLASLKKEDAPLIILHPRARLKTLSTGRTPPNDKVVLVSIIKVEMNCQCSTEQAEEIAASV